MSSHVNEFGQFLGHFHPMLVHLPVGGLVVLGALELLAALPRFRNAAQNRRTILGLVAAGALSAAACGWLLAGGGGYDAQLLYRHRWTGIGVAAACIVTFLLCGANWLRAYRVALLTTLVLLVLAGHFGSELTHGSGFLTLYAPGPLRALLGAPARPITSDPAPADANSAYAQVVQPLLQRRCVSCHGPEKQKGELRLDSLAGLRKGGQDGPVLVAGSAGESLMIRRLLLPIEHDDHMPPEGKPQPTPAEIGLLQWWINAGAPGDRSVASLNPSAEVMRLLETVAASQRH
jgi:mono/diheme cytochrome c family protein